MLFGILNFFHKNHIEEDYSTYNINERMEVLKSLKIDGKVIEYLKKCFENLTIEINCEELDIFEAMQYKLLSDTPFQTTETAIVFLDDDDYLVRGDIKVGSYKELYHSWIVFTYDGKEYIFDPSLNLLCYKDIYEDVFEVTINNKIPAITVKKAILALLRGKKESTKKDILVSPLYCNNAIYNGIIDNGVIKSLKAIY